MCTVRQPAAAAATAADIVLPRSTLKAAPGRQESLEPVELADSPAVRAVN